MEQCQKYSNGELTRLQFVKSINPFAICEVCWVLVWCTYGHLNTRDQF
jgi:hypothetical protein